MGDMMENKNELYLDATKNMTKQYIYEWFNLFIPEFNASPKFISFHQTQSIPTLNLLDINGGEYRIWQPHFNTKPNMSGYVNYLLDNGNTIHEVNLEDNMQPSRRGKLPVIVFAKDGNIQEYKYLGVFKLDESRETDNNRWYIKVADIADFTINPPIIHYFDGKEYKEEIQSIKAVMQEVDKIDGITSTEREAIVKSRVGQGIFRDKLISRYSNCMICGISNERLLRASHIKDWSKSNDDERLDSDNGLLLCAQHDALFDNGLVYFDQEGKIVMSEYLSFEDRKILGLDENIVIDMNESTKEYMAWHERDVKKKSKIVKHNKFGIGIIISTNEERVSVRFNNGESKQFLKKSLNDGTLTSVF